MPTPIPAAKARAAPRRSALRIALRVLRGGALVYVACAALLFGLQRRLLFPREAAHTDPSVDQRHPSMQHLQLPTEDGPVEALLMPAVREDALGPGPAVVFAHGNGETVDQWPDWLEGYSPLGVAVLIPEYRGYGRSAGAPSQEAIVADFVRWFDLLAARPEVDPKRIVFHGRSLGGGVVAALAEKRKPAAIVLQSTFTRVRDIAARRYFMPGFLVRDPFDTADTLPRLGVPVLLAHGRRDSVVPFEHAEALARRVPGARLLAHDTDHNDCPPDWDAWMREIAPFLRTNGVL